MTDKTFWHWINRYADCVRELSWAGGIQSGIEREQVILELKRDKKNARKHIKQALDDLVS